MNLNAEICQRELTEAGIIPRKYYGQVFTVDPQTIESFAQTVKQMTKPGMRIVEIGGGLGYLTEALAKALPNNPIDVLEIDEQLLPILNKKFVHNSNINILQQDIMHHQAPQEPYLLVGNIPFHVSGKLYRRFMSDEAHKPAGWVIITDKQYAQTLMGQPPKSYRVSLQAQVYGDLEIVADVPKTGVYPPPKVDCCILKITANPKPIPKNFWDVVNYHFDNFPTPEVESPKTMSLKDWIQLAKKANPPV